MKPTDTAVVYLARGAEIDHLARFDRFIQSYCRIESGLSHTLYVIFKGYSDSAALQIARRCFSPLTYIPLFLDDDSYDIGAYASAARLVTEETVCFVNSNSEIIADRWLGKLYSCLDQDGVGMVGASGSFESLGRSQKAYFPPRPNVHLRSNVFMLRRKLAVQILGSFVVRSKIDAFLAESGQGSITREVYRLGLATLVVGRDGRGFSPPFWPTCQGFRSGDQSNLLAADNISREFDRLPPAGQWNALCATWGRYANPDCVLGFP